MKRTKGIEGVMTPLQYLVLSHLWDHFSITSDRLQSLLSDTVPDFRGPGFYGFMKEMKKKGYVEIEKDGPFKQSRYKRTPAGKEACRLSHAFYDNLRHHFSEG